jgi:hypothetical protein
MSCVPRNDFRPNCVRADIRGRDARLLRPRRRLSDSAPTVFDDTQIGALIAGGHVRENSAYLVFFPPETTVTSGALTSCRAFDGYHDQWPRPGFAGTLDGGLDDTPDAVPPEQDEGAEGSEATDDASSGGPADAERPATGFLYAVFPRCLGPLAAIDALTVATSHEKGALAKDRDWRAGLHRDRRRHRGQSRGAAYGAFVGFAVRANGPRPTPRRARPLRRARWFEERG